ncbi:hypothetical protein A9Q87_03245 [Flavobacteriales bacterium 34_180_T64]|nr:hypothetical protein A9Q87_03245 [Flavobacteriales bacterium 34_180_T64]
MKLLITLFLISTSVVSQKSDFNTKKGFAAEGYDVVAYFNNQAIEGSIDYVATHNGVKYKFISETNLKQFLSQPDRYSPQYGGFCAYAIAVKSKKVKINPDTFEIRDGKLYLFYNSWGTNTLELWQKENVKGLIKKADQNWEAITLD